MQSKQVMRSDMRALRRALDDQDARSSRIWATVQDLPEVELANTVMVFSSIRGEPITAPFIEWCKSEDKRVVLPEDDPPPDPQVVDVVIIPGVAFTNKGQRLGQGGGWYDRFLPQLRSTTPKIGVCFAEQIVNDLPVEPHDVVLDQVVTDQSSS